MHVVWVGIQRLSNDLSTDVVLPQTQEKTPLCPHSLPTFSRYWVRRKLALAKAPATEAVMYPVKKVPSTIASVDSSSSPYSETAESTNIRLHADKARNIYCASKYNVAQESYNGSCMNVAKTNGEKCGSAPIQAGNVGLARRTATLRAGK